MKKLFLFAATMLLSMNLMALTTYPVQVAGIDVTDANALDVFGDGHVSYDADENRLLLDNANITGTIWYHPVWAEDSEFSIWIVGKCKITLDGTQSAGAIYSQAARTTIMGFANEPELIISSTKHEKDKGTAINAFADGTVRELIIDGLKLVATSDTYYAIRCSNLKVRSATFIEAKAGDKFPALECDMSKVSYTGTKLAYDLHNDPSKTLHDHNRIIIAPEASIQEYTDMLILGEPVTNYTKDDVMQNGEGDTWDAEKKVLTLGGEDYETSENKVFFNFSAPATLAFEHGNYKNLSAKGTQPFIKTSANLTITSPVDIGISAMGSCAIALEPSAKAITLTFDKANISSLSGTAYSIQKTGTSLAAANVSFINSHVQMANVKNIANANFEGCAVTGMGSGSYSFDPAYGFVDDMMCTPDCTPMSDVLITAEAYPISINSIPVYPYNASDIWGDGTLSYNHATKTLTIAEGADLIGGTVCPVVSVANQDLTILFKGKPLGFFGDYYQAIKMTNGKKLTLISAPGGKNEAIEIASNNTDKLPVIDADGADVEFRGVLPFKVQVDKGGAVDYYVNAPLIKANKLIVNAALVLNNPNTATEADVLANVPVELNENIALDGTDVQINAGTHMVEWKTPKADKIREVSFVAKELDEGASITIAGIKVTKLNKGDILGDGKISYDETAKKLTLNNATIHATTANAIYPDYIPGEKLTIEVKGTNVITCDKMHGITSISCNIDIVGVGTAPYLSIDVEAGGSDFMAYFCYGENLLVKDVTLLVTSHHALGSAIHIGSIVGHLTVDNADLRVAVEESSSTIVAILCNQLTMNNGVALRYDDIVWPMITWEGDHFDGADRTHIWIGKNAEFPTDIEDTFVPTEKAAKILRNGQIFILRGDRIYTITGQPVK